MSKIEYTRCDYCQKSEVDKLSEAAGWICFEGKLYQYLGVALAPNHWESDYMAGNYQFCSTECFFARLRKDRSPATKNIDLGGPPVNRKRPEEEDSELSSSWHRLGQDPIEDEKAPADAHRSEIEGIHPWPHKLDDTPF